MSVVLNITPVTTQVFRLVVRHDAPDSYKIPGQYAVISATGFKGGYFSMASSPGEDWLFLIKKDSPLSQHLSTLKAGDVIDVSPAQGKGFNLKACEGRDVYCFAGGTGITPIRPCIRAMLSDRKKYGAIHLFFGVRSAEDFYFQEEFEDWKKAGVTITQTVEPAHPAWTGKTGFVQSHLGPMDPARSAALLCGPKNLVDDVRTTLLQKGLPPELILTNF